MSYAFDSDDAWDFVPTCRYHESCTRLLDPHGCDSCACREDGLRHDENGEPFHLEDDALDL